MANNETTRKCYIGDSVYVEEELGMIRLSTNNGEQEDGNEIYLEPAVWQALKDWMKRGGLDE